MNLNLKRPIVFFDLETTGVDTAKDRIVEISMVKVMPNGDEITRTRLINPQMHIPEQATAIHNITDEMVRDEPTFAQIAKSLAQFIDGCDFGGFNSNRFDLPMLAEEFMRAEVDVDFFKRAKYVDVQNIFHKKEERTLVAAYRFYCNKELEALGYTLYTDLNTLGSIPAEGKVLGLFASGDLPSAKSGKRGEYLANATQKALDILTNNTKKNKKKGFVLMVEGSKIDGESHSRSPEGILAETRDFANAINVAMDYADTHPGTLVVVVSDHETGGLSIPSNKTDFTLPESGIGYAFGTSSHTATMVPVYLYGTGANLIEGVMENSELGQKVQEIINLGDKK